MRPKAPKFVGAWGGGKPLPRPLPLDAFGVSTLGAYGASNVWPPTFKTVPPPLGWIVGLPVHKKVILLILCRGAIPLGSYTLSPLDMTKSPLR